MPTNPPLPPVDLSSPWARLDAEASPASPLPDSNSQRQIFGLPLGRFQTVFEWRDGLGLYWLVSLFLMLALFYWLASVGVPQVVLVPLILLTLLGITVFHVWAYRTARPPRR